jgi:hypothetical protein
LKLNAASSLPFTWRHKALRTSNKTQVFQFFVITSLDMRICVSICSVLSTALANTDCEGVPVTHIFIHSPFITLYLFYLIYFTVPYRSYPRNSVTRLSCHAAANCTLRDYLTAYGLQITKRYTYSIVKLPNDKDYHST